MNLTEINQIQSHISIKIISIRLADIQGLHVAENIVSDPCLFFSSNPFIFPFSEITIKNSLFSTNKHKITQANSIKSNIYGVAISFLKINSVLFENSTFYKNIHNKTSTHMIGGPAIVFLIGAKHSQANLLIKSSSFIENQCLYGSCAIEFIGVNLTISKSIFLKNTNLMKNIHSKEDTYGIISAKSRFVNLFDLLISNSIFTNSLIFIENQELNITAKGLIVKNIQGYLNAGFYFLECYHRNIKVYDSFFENLENYHYGGIIILLVSMQRTYSSQILFKNITVKQVRLKRGSIFGIWDYCLERTQNQHVFQNIFAENITMDTTLGSASGIINLYNLNGIEMNGYLLNSTFLNILTTTQLVLTNQIKFFGINNTIFGINTTKGVYTFFNSEIEILNLNLLNINNLLYVIHGKEQTSFKLKNAQILKINSTNHFFEFEDKCTCFIENSSFVNIINRESAFVLLRVFVKLVINESIFTNIQAMLTFSVENSVTVLKNTKFQKIKNSFFKLSYGELNITSSTFQNKDCEVLNHFFHFEFENKIHIENSFFSNFYLKNTKNFIILQALSKLFITNSYFQYFSSKDTEKNTLILASQSSLFINLTSFLYFGDFQQFIFITGRDSSVKIYSTKFTNPKPFTNISLLACENCKTTFLASKILFLYSNLLNNSQISLTNGELFIENCVFHNNLNKFSFGGVLNLQEVDSKIKNTVFTSNIGLRGGVISFETRQNNYLKSNLYIENSKFVNNSAILNGGAIFWNLKMPNKSNNSNVFQNNLAQYGNDFSTGPLRLFYKIIELRTNKTISNTYSDLLNNTNTVLGYLEQVSSGLEFPFKIELQALDFYLNIIKESFTSFVKINAHKAKNYKNYLKLFDFLENEENYSLYLYGKKVVNQNKNNIFVINQLHVDIPTKSQIVLKIETDLIDPLQINFMHNVLKYKFKFLENEIVLNRNQYFLLIPIKINYCPIGYVYNDKIYFCKYCEVNSYSLSILDKKCKNCPKNADCSGGINIKLHAGFWRESIYSEDIYECAEKTQCLGGFHSKCKDPYQGILCAYCTQNKTKYFNNENQECIKCFPTHILFSLFIVYISVQVIFFKFLTQLHLSLTKKSELFMLRLLIDYFHLIYIFSFLEKNIPKFRTSHMMLFLNFGNYFYKCLFLTYSSYQMLMFSFLETLLHYIKIIVIIIVNKAWINRKYKTNNNAKKIYFKISFEFILFIYSPFLFGDLFSNTFCFKYKNEFRLKYSPNQKCYDLKYFLWIFLFYYPLIAFWFFVTPLITFCYLKKINWQDNLALNKLFFGKNPKSKQIFDYFIYFVKLFSICIAKSSMEQFQKTNAICIVFIYTLAIFLYCKKFYCKYSRKMYIVIFGISTLFLYIYDFPVSNNKLFSSIQVFEFFLQVFIVLVLIYFTKKKRFRRFSRFFETKGLIVKRKNKMKVNFDMESQYHFFKTNEIIRNTKHKSN